jgi:hypothetical protein
MAYLDIISLQEAKDYLRVDEDFTEDDGQITLMIETALEHIEQITRVILFARESTYIKNEDGTARVYDAPINSITSPTDVLRVDKGLYSLFTYDGDEIVLNVGYVDAANVPSWVQIIGLELIAIYYYQKQSGEKSALSEASRVNLAMKRRFVM